MLTQHFEALARPALFCAVGARMYYWRIAWVKTVTIGLRALPAWAIISRGGKIIGKPALAGKAIVDLFAIPDLNMLGRQFVDKP